MEYRLSEIAEITNGKLYASSDDKTLISNLIYDSRKLVFPENTLFIAIVGDRNDGHKYLLELYKKGVRFFLVQQKPNLKKMPKAGFIKTDDTLKALEKYKAVKRRQEVRLEKDGLVLIEDFAHHPTAVGLTVTMLKEAFPDKKLWAVFEPRSNTSRRKVFQDDYVKGFQQADQAIISQIKTKAVDSGHDLIDVDQLAAAISDKGTACAALPDADSIADKLIAEVGDNDAVVVMSNGSFDGLMAKLVEGFEGR